jgi:hypothetical protein
MCNSTDPLILYGELSLGDEMRILPPERRHFDYL